MNFSPGTLFDLSEIQLRFRDGVTGDALCESVGFSFNQGDLRWDVQLIGNGMPPRGSLEV
jgi:hypothetical protein